MNSDSKQTLPWPKKLGDVENSTGNQAAFDMAVHMPLRRALCSGSPVFFAFRARSPPFCAIGPVRETHRTRWDQKSRLRDSYRVSPYSIHFDTLMPTIALLQTYSPLRIEWHLDILHQGSGLYSTVRCTARQKWIFAGARPGPCGVGDRTEIWAVSPRCLHQQLKLFSTSPRPLRSCTSKWLPVTNWL